MKQTKLWDAAGREYEIVKDGRVWYTLIDGRRVRKNNLRSELWNYRFFRSLEALSRERERRELWDWFRNQYFSVPRDHATLDRLERMKEIADEGPE